MRSRAATLVTRYVSASKGFSRIDIDTNESDPSTSLAGQLMGLPLKPLQGFGVPAESYGFANKQLAWETIAPLLDRASPLRTAHLRDRIGPQIQFASEFFIDQIAFATGTDPVAVGRRSQRATSGRSERERVTRIPTTTLYKGLLRFVEAKEVGVTERADDILVIIEYFVKNAVMPSHVEKDYDVLIRASTFAMHVPWWAGSVAANRTNFLERAVGFIEAMLALNDESIIRYHMSMENDLFIGIEFEQHMDDIILFIDAQDRI